MLQKLSHRHFRDRLAELVGEQIWPLLAFSGDLQRDGLERLDMFRPLVQRLAFLICESVALVHARDAPKRSRYVIQYLFDHRQGDT
jgi:hypothetical protein